jgi:hypothetical protein
MNKDKFKSYAFFGSICEQAENFWEKEIINPFNCNNTRSDLKEEKREDVQNEKVKRGKVLFKISNTPTLDQILEKNNQISKKIENDNISNFSNLCLRDSSSISRLEQNSSKWTKQEDELLLKLTTNIKMKRNWQMISKFIGSKSANQCIYRFKKLKCRINNNELLGKIKHNNDHDILVKNQEFHGKEIFEKHKRNRCHLNFSNSLSSKDSIHILNSTANESDLMKIAKPCFHIESHLDYEDMICQEINENVNLSKGSPLKKGNSIIY